MRFGYHPFNLGLRFFLELAGLFGLGWWGSGIFNRPLRWLGAVLVVVFASLVWGTFRKPGDGSASGKALVVIPGWLRLGLEIVFFGLAILGYYFKAGGLAAGIFAVLVFGHYLFSIDRVSWLLSGE